MRGARAGTFRNCQIWSWTATASPSPFGPDRHPHRAGEVAVGQYQPATVRGRGGQDQLPGVVGRDQERYPMLGQEAASDRLYS